MYATLHLLHAIDATLHLPHAINAKTDTSHTLHARTLTITYLMYAFCKERQVQMANQDASVILLCFVMIALQMMPQQDTNGS
jgi:hypothetical protein